MCTKTIFTRHIRTKVTFGSVGSGQPCSPRWVDRIQIRRIRIQIRPIERVRIQWIRWIGIPILPIEHALTYTGMPLYRAHSASLAMAITRAAFCSLAQFCAELLVMILLRNSWGTGSDFAVHTIMILLRNSWGQVLTLRFTQS